jgi:anaerobic selenocysteine-containing dehydrogenase
VLLEVRDGKLVGIEGDPDHPYNHGSTCPRALTLKEYAYHPDRLRYPMKRVGKRGEDRWERISWEETYDELEHRMAAIKDRYGPESMAFIQGTGRDVGAWLLTLAYSYGSPNWLQGGLTGNSCYHPRLGAMKVVQGDFAVPDCGQFLPDRFDDPDFQLPEVIAVWGYNPPVTCTDGLYGNWIVECMKRGTKAIVIDPYYTWTASRAEPIRSSCTSGAPGSISSASASKNTRRPVSRRSPGYRRRRYERRPACSPRASQPQCSGAFRSIWHPKVST